MSVPKLFIHGVPDTPAIWQPLLRSLGDVAADDSTPALPGFKQPAPKGFPCTKDAYADWLIREIEAIHARSGPIDLVGHDWGALLTLRVASLRPELLRSWVISNAAIDPLYQGHRVARMWNRPLLGELLMAVTRADALEKSLAEAGVPADVAAAEAAAWKLGHMKPCILKLYRSANGLRFKGPWVDDLANLPKKGLLVWGPEDPYVPLDVGMRFSEQHGVDIKLVEGTGHWAIAQKPDDVAQHLATFWQSV